MMMIIFTVKFTINDSISQRRYRTIMTKNHDLLHTCENKKFQINFWDQYQYLGNCPPTPPLTLQQSIDDKLRLMLGQGRGRWAVAQILILIQFLSFVNLYNNGTLTQRGQALKYIYVLLKLFFQQFQVTIKYCSSLHFIALKTCLNDAQKKLRFLSDYDPGIKLEEE